MDWKSTALRALGLKALLLGAVAGLWASLLGELARALLPAPSDPLLSAVPLLALGLTLGALLAPADSLLNRFPRRAARAALAGGVLGALAALLGHGGLGLLHAALPAQGPRWLGGAGFSAQMALFGAAVGFASAMGGARWALARRRAAHGLWAGALLGGLLAALLAVAGDRAGVYPAGLAAWAALLAWLLFWRELRFARRWLRVVSGPGEDSLFPLLGNKVTLGRLESNDIPLPHHREVFPRHCLLTRGDGAYRIIDEEQGGLVLVNFRQTQEQTLKPGDLLKVGTALLQYGEAK